MTDQEAAEERAAGRPEAARAPQRAVPQAVPPKVPPDDPQVARQAAPPAAPHNIQLHLEVPASSNVGDKLQITTGFGTFNFVVPQGAAAGKKITVTLPAPATYVVPPSGVPVTKFICMGRARKRTRSQAGQDPPAGPMTIEVQMTRGTETLKLQVEPGDTIARIKELIEEKEQLLDTHRHNALQ